MESAFTIPPLNLAVQVLNIALMIVVPFVAAAIIRRRLGVGWKLFWLGALVFVVSQLLLRLPLVAMLQAALGPQIIGSPLLSFGLGLLLAFTAALFETGGRYVGYRFLLRRTSKTWNVGVMFGLGHGGIESALLVAGLATTQLVTLLTLTQASLAALPPVQAEALGTLAAAVNGEPAWLGLAGAWERMIALLFHVAMSLLVLQSFVRGERRWLGYALGAHFLMDFVTPTLIPALLPAGMARGGAQQAVLLAAGLFSLWVIRAMRPVNQQANSIGRQAAA